MKRKWKPPKGTNLKTGYTISSDPLKRATYHCWQSIIQRCLNPNNSAFADYGGRGIKVCKRWLESFENFLQDMGRKPSSKLSIDRKDNDGDYTPRNCRWATQKVQISNRQRNRKRIKLPYKFRWDDGTRDIIPRGAREGKLVVIQRKRKQYELYN